MSLWCIKAVKSVIDSSFCCSASMLHIRTETTQKSFQKQIRPLMITFSGNVCTPLCFLLQVNATIFSDKK